MLPTWSRRKIDNTPGKGAVVVTVLVRMACLVVPPILKNRTPLIRVFYPSNLSGLDLDYLRTLRTQNRLGHTQTTSRASESLYYHSPTHLAWGLPFVQSKILAELDQGQILAEWTKGGAGTMWGGDTDKNDVEAWKVCILVMSNAPCDLIVNPSPPLGLPRFFEGFKAVVSSFWPFLKDKL